MKYGPRQVLIALDILANAILWGNGRMTISARTGLAAAKGAGWAKRLVPVIDAVFGQGHCAEEAAMWREPD